MSTATLPAAAAAAASTPTRELVPATDRCDRCGAQAFVATHIKGHRSELLWCCHHYRQHRGALEKAEAVVLADKSETLNVAPSVSANAL